MQFVMVLTADEKRHLYYQFLTVVNAIRYLHPHDRISVLSDDKTSSRMSISEDIRELDGILKIVDIKRFSHNNAVVRSRALKTMMRNEIEGDFVYIDSDALPVRSMAAISSETSVAAALDRKSIRDPGSTPNWITEVYASVGWRPRIDEYRNSGVIYWKDDPDGREAGRLWHERWMQLFDTRSFHKDQASFNYVLDACAGVGSTLDQKWNALVSFDPRFSRNANIYHYFTSVERPADHLLDKLANSIRQGHGFDSQTFDKFRLAEDPWAGCPCSFAEAMTTGHYARGVYLAAGNLLSPSLPLSLFRRVKRTLIRRIGT